MPCLRSSRTATTALAGLLLLAGGARSVTAEDSIPESVVLDLIQIAPRWGDQDPSIQVGGLPADVAGEWAIPEGIDILVSVTWGEDTSAVAETELSKAAAVGRIESSLAEYGWKPREPVVKQSGFLPSSEDKGKTLCSEEGDSLLIEVPSGHGESNIVHLRFGGGRRASCDQLERYDAMMDHHFGDIPFPTLYPPDGAKSHGSGRSSSGSRGREESTMLEADLTPGDVLAHYADQMAPAGWQGDAAADYDSMGYQSWLLFDDAGSEWHGLMLVLPGHQGEGHWEVSLRVTLLKEG